MIPWTAAPTDLRNLISDGDTDRNAYRKKCFGYVDGMNTSYKTLEFRRVTDFSDDSSSAAPLGVYVSGVRVPYTSITSDDTPTGEFVLMTAPTGSQVIEASYYYRWFLDSEITLFLEAAAEWLTSVPNYLLIPEGLRPAAKYYAAQEAMHKMAARWVEKQSEQYLIEDQPDPRNKGVPDSYRLLANDYKKKSVELRDQYYTRQGQALQPLFVSSPGVVGANQPSR